MDGKQHGIGISRKLNGKIKKEEWKEGKKVRLITEN
jgi:hypothetical protein